MVLHQPMLIQLFLAPLPTNSSLRWPFWLLVSIYFLIISLYQYHFLLFRHFGIFVFGIRCAADYKIICHLDLVLPSASGVVEVLMDEVNPVLLLGSDRCLYFAGGHTFVVDN